MKILVLGAGMVGGPMALDLAADPDFQVTVADRDEAALARLRERADLRTLTVDLSSPATVGALAADHQLVLGAVPGFLGTQTLRAVIEAERDVVDISFSAEDPFLLDDLARARGVTAIVDCGVFPGMGSALVGRAARRLDAVERLTTYVGGLPEVRRQPWEYAAVFSPVDVIEEYTRPARMVRDGILVTRPALSEVELLDFPGLGTLEAFNTDGLRTLLRTLDAPHMTEKTLRYPGHAARMLQLREGGFFSAEPVRVGDRQVRPLDVTAAVLFPQWTLPEGEGDLTVLQIEVAGRKDGAPKVFRYDLLDRWDRASGTSSMARTTGYTATMAVRLLAAGRYRRPGISPPEYLGREPGCVSFLLEGLRQRGVIYREETTSS